MKKVFGEASGNGRVLREESEWYESQWDELMEEVDELVLRGELSESQAAMVGQDGMVDVVELVRERHGQEQVWTWTWNDPSRMVGWDELVVGGECVDLDSSGEEERTFGHWWK